MSDVKLGLNQTSKPAPLGYRKFMNAFIAAGAPAFTGFIMSIDLSEHTQKVSLAVVVLVTGLIKVAGMVLGNGQIYSPSNQVVEDQAGKN